MSLLIFDLSFIAILLILEVSLIYAIYIGSISIIFFLLYHWSEYQDKTDVHNFGWKEKRERLNKRKPSDYLSRLSYSNTFLFLLIIIKTHKTFFRMASYWSYRPLKSNEEKIHLKYFEDDVSTSSKGQLIEAYTFLYLLNKISPISNEFYLELIEMVNEK